MTTATTPALVFDSFHPKAEEVRWHALRGHFAPVEHDGHIYRGIGKHVPNGIQSAIERCLETPINMRMVFFRLNGEQDDTTSWIHADMGCGRYAALWYLNPDEQCQGGTAFWRHKQLGWDRLPSLEEMIAREMKIKEVADQLRADANDESLWEQRGVVDMKFNRLVVYETNEFHSRWPREAFGTTKEDSRLILVAFFDD